VVWRDRSLSSFLKTRREGISPREGLTIRRRREYSGDLYLGGGSLGFRGSRDTQGRRGKVNSQLLGGRGESPAGKGGRAAARRSERSGNRREKSLEDKS